MSGNILDASSDSLRFVETLALTTDQPSSTFIVFGAENGERVSDGSLDAIVVNESEASSFAWNGRELQADSEMQYHRARYFDSTPGRWLDCK